MTYNTSPSIRFLSLSTWIVLVSCITEPESSQPTQGAPVVDKSPVAQAYAVDQPEIGEVEVLGSDLQGRVVLGETSVGASVYLSNYSNKVVLVNYWSSWCTSCWQRVLDMQKLQMDYGQPTLAVVHVNYGETDQTVKNYLATKNLVPGMTLLTDHSGQASEAQGVFELPATILYDQTGQEIGRYVDDFDVNGVRKQLDTLLP